MTIELTAAQARALADFAAREGSVALHQVPPGGQAAAAAADGEISPIGETLPAAE
jgi:hypothetical protein